MSFYFGGVGTRKGVVEKLKNQTVSGGQEAASKIRDLVIEIIENEMGEHPADSTLNGVEVSISGHFEKGRYGTSSLSITMTEREVSLDPTVELESAVEATKKTEEVPDGGDSTA